MEKHNTLEESLDTFSESVDRLLKDPNFENAYEAQLASIVAFREIYGIYQHAGGLKPEIYEQFTIDSNDCETGFGLIKDKEDRISRFFKQVEFRKDLAIELKSGNLDYVSQRISEEDGKVRKVA